MIHFFIIINLGFLIHNDYKISVLPASQCDRLRFIIYFDNKFAVANMSSTCKFYLKFWPLYWKGV